MERLMNLQQLKRNVGTRVQLVPNVCYLNEFGAERSRIDDDWIIQAIDDEEIQISNDSGYSGILGKDHINSRKRSHSSFHQQSASFSV